MPRKTSSPAPKPDRKPAPPRAPREPQANGERSGANPRAVTSPRHVHLGDELRIERRYVVDGALTSVTDKGTFQGLQVLGSTEHLVIEDGARDVRMIPLHSISEITIVSAARKSERDAFDPSFA